MKIVDVSGDARTLGRHTGEALREEIRTHLEMFPGHRNRPDWTQRLPTFLDTLRRDLLQVLEEMEGTAEGARILHGLSPRKTGPFVQVSCGAIPGDWWRANCSDTNEVPSPEPCTENWARWSWPKAVRCS